MSSHLNNISCLCFWLNIDWPENNWIQTSDRGPPQFIITLIYFIPPPHTHSDLTKDNTHLFDCLIYKTVSYETHLYRNTNLQHIWANTEGELHSKPGWCHQRVITRVTAWRLRVLLNAGLIPSWELQFLPPLKTCKRIPDNLPKLQYIYFQQ